MIADWFDTCLICLRISNPLNAQLQTFQLLQTVENFSLFSIETLSTEFQRRFLHVKTLGAAAVWWYDYETLCIVCTRSQISLSYYMTFYGLSLVTNVEAMYSCSTGNPYGSQLLAAPKTVKNFFTFCNVYRKIMSGNKNIARTLWRLHC